MTELRVKHLFRSFAIVNFFISIVLLLFYQTLDISERISMAVVINLGYFMFYFFLSRLLPLQFKWIKNNSKLFIFQVHRKMMMLFIICLKLIAFLFLLGLIVISIVKREYEGLFALCVPVGIYLGATLGRLRILEIKS